MSVSCHGKNRTIYEKVDYLINLGVHVIFSKVYMYRCFYPVITFFFRDGQISMYIVCTISAPGSAVAGYVVINEIKVVFFLLQTRMDDVCQSKRFLGILIELCFIFYLLMHSLDREQQQKIDMARKSDWLLS